jgi:hypothetical protein
MPMTTEQVSNISAGVALKAGWPLELEKILVTGMRFEDPSIKLDFGSGKIVGDGEVCHCGLLFRRMRDQNNKVV